MAVNELLEKELDELYKKVKKGESLGQKRRWSAYALKIVAGGAGLAIATGLLSGIDQILGVVVLVAVFIDQVFSNHMRLISETQAAHAYRALARKVKADFNPVRNPIALKASEGDAKAQSELDELMRNAHKALSEGINEIESGLEATDIKALKALSLETKEPSSGGA